MPLSHFHADAVLAPAEQATIPLVVERRHLLSANSLYDHDDGFGGSGICGGEPLLAIADTLTVQLGGGLNLGREMVVGAVMPRWNFAVAAQNR